MRLPTPRPQVLPTQLDSIRRVALEQLLSVHRSVLLRESMLQLGKHGRALVKTVERDGAHSHARALALGWAQAIATLVGLDDELSARVASIEAGLSTTEPVPGTGAERNVDVCGGYAVACRLRGHVFDAHAAVERFLVGAQRPAAGGADGAAQQYEPATLKALQKVASLLADLIDVVDQQRERTQPLCADRLRLAREMHRHDRVAKRLRQLAVAL
jgi:hypothetical protein